MRKLILAVFVLVYFNANALEVVGVKVKDAILYQGAYDKSNPRIIVTEIVKKNCGDVDTSGKWRTATKTDLGYIYGCKFQPQNTKAYLIVIYECYKPIHYKDKDSEFHIFDNVNVIPYFDIWGNKVARIAYVKGGTSVSTKCTDQ